MRGRAGGFCYINDIGLAVERLKSAGKKVLYLDIDAHHGDGVQDAFYADPGVLKVSFHETGRTLFPFTGFEDETGAGPGDGYNVNVPLHNNADDEVFLWLFRRLFPPLYDWFKPDVTLAQIGVDMMSTDPLTHLRLTNNAYVEAVQMINAHSGAAVFFGGGGYSPENIVRGYTLAWAAISGADIGDDYGLAMLGGQFLGSSGMNTLSSLKDMNIYLSGPDKVSAVAEAQRVYKTVKSNVGRKLGLELPD
jgi:acetoin utilization protein AcuC